MKSSVQRQIRTAVLSQWKIEPETLEVVWPKKEGLVHVKWFVPLVCRTRKGHSGRSFLCMFLSLPTFQNTYIIVQQRPYFDLHSELRAVVLSTL